MEVKSKLRLNIMQSVWPSRALIQIARALLWCNSSESASVAGGPYPIFGLFLEDNLQPSAFQKKCWILTWRLSGLLQIILFLQFFAILVDCYLFGELSQVLSFECLCWDIPPLNFQRLVPFYNISRHLFNADHYLEVGNRKYYMCHNVPYKPHLPLNIKYIQGRDGRGLADTNGVSCVLSERLW